MKVSMRLPAGLDLIPGMHYVFLVDLPGGHTVEVHEAIYVYQKNPRVHYLVWSRCPGNDFIIDGIANPYFLTRFLPGHDPSSAYHQAHNRILRDFVEHYSRPVSEWNVDVKGNVLLETVEPEQAEEQVEQGSWRDRPPML